MALIFHFAQQSNDYKVYAVTCMGRNRSVIFVWFGFDYIEYVGIVLHWEKGKFIHTHGQIKTILARLAQSQSPRQITCLLMMEMWHCPQYYTKSSWLHNASRNVSYQSLHILATKTANTLSHVISYGEESGGSQMGNSCLL